MAKKLLEDKILDILIELNEEVPYENLGGPTPSETLKGPIDYAKNIQKAHVPQAHAIPGVGEIGSDDASQDKPITDVIGSPATLGEDEEEPEDEKKDGKEGDDEDEDEDDKEDKDLEETFSSLLARLAEEDLDEDETSLKDSGADFGTPEETLPDVDSELETPDKLVTKAPGIKIAECECGQPGCRKCMKEDETSLKGDNGGTPKETLPTVDSELETPDKLAVPSVGGKTPNEPYNSMKEDINAIFTGTKLTEAAKQRQQPFIRQQLSAVSPKRKQRVQQVATKKLKEAFAVLKARSEKKQRCLRSKS